MLHQGRSASRGHSGRKTNLFKEKPKFVWISKKPNWVPAEWCWRLRFENTMGYFVKISWNNNKISHCASKSQPSAPFSCDSIWLLLDFYKHKQIWDFLKGFVFLPQNVIWSTVMKRIIHQAVTILFLNIFIYTRYTIKIIFQLFILSDLLLRINSNES